jgi:hypothetical protein
VWQGDPEALGLEHFSLSAIQHFSERSLELVGLMVYEPKQDSVLCRRGYRSIAYAH